MSDWAASGYTCGGALTREGAEHVRSVLPAMRAAGLGWLTPILADLALGDPYQDGITALAVVDAWKEREHG